LISRNTQAASSVLLVVAAFATCALMLPRASLAEGPHADSSSAPSASASASVGTNGTVIHVGDSFVDAGLQQALRPMFASRGTRYRSYGRVRGWLATWSENTNIELLIQQHHASLVLITLGANEMVDQRPQARGVLVRRLVGRLHGTPCVWIGHPLWRGVGPGLMEVVRRECAPCRFFDSVPLSNVIQRQPDGIHPDAKGGAFWARAVFDFLMLERDPTRGYWALKPAPVGEHGEPSDGATEQ
jgi:hypothetical protein